MRFCGVKPKIFIKKIVQVLVQSFFIVYNASYTLISSIWVNDDLAQNGVHIWF